MDTDRTQQPWEDLHLLVEKEDAERVKAYLEGLPPGEAARALSRMNEEDQTHLLTIIGPEEAADLIEQLPDVQAVELVEHLDPAAAAAIVHELPSDEQADLVGDLNRDDADAILAEMAPDEAQNVRTLSQYADDVAGGLMITEFVAYPETLTVAEVIDDIRIHAERYRDYYVQYAYVTTEQGKLAGVLRLRDLLLARATQPVSELTIRDPLSVPADATLDELRDLFDSSGFYGIPVTDAEHRLVGIVRRADVEEALGDRFESDYRRSHGIVTEELRTMPVWLRARRRLGWLSVNIVLNVIAASVIAFYQDTLSAVIALAVFLPIISDMSGCSGNQAVAVSIREITLGLVKPSEFFRVWLKEALVGLINGAVLGLLIALVAWLWQSNAYLGLVVGGAMALNTLIAVSVGGVVPLLLKRMKKDPALASGPILTTITDMCGFFLVLSFARAALPLLVAS